MAGSTAGSARADAASWADGIVRHGRCDHTRAGSFLERRSCGIRACAGRRCIASQRRFRARFLRRGKCDCCGARLVCPALLAAVSWTSQLGPNWLGPPAANFGCRLGQRAAGEKCRRDDGYPSRALLRRAATNSGMAPELWKIGPADVYSGQAQRALYLMKEEPMLFDATVEEELMALREQRDEEQRQTSALKETTKEDTLMLRRRMDEVRKNERARIVTELLYLKVCRSFQQLHVPLIPPLKEGGDAKLGPIDLRGLTADVYSEDALELVREHLFGIVGHQGGASFVGGLGMGVVQIALFQAGQVYAMSALFGYYLRRVDARYQLEKLAGTFGAWGDASPGPDARAQPGFVSEDQAAVQSLKDYIESFGPEEVQRVASVASVEAQMAMERQVAALFGDLRVLKEKLINALGDSGTNEEVTQRLLRAIDSREVESLRITSDDLRRLVLEAVAYGALLNDSEKQVDLLYELTPSSRPLGALIDDDDSDIDGESRMLPE